MSTGNNEYRKYLKAPLDILGSIGSSLAEGVKKDPYISGIVLIVLITAVVVTTAAAGVNVFLAIAIAAIIGITIMFCVGIRSQRGKIEHYSGIGLDTGKNTVKLVDQLNDHDKQVILNALKEATEDVAEVLKISNDHIRANLFGVDNRNRMRMIAGLTYHMDRDEELTISMPVGYGSTGRCFQSGKPNIAIFREGWGKDLIEDKELRKVHPDLQWIISVPVLSGNEGGRPFWVLNVDGLVERREKEDLHDGLKRLFVWSQMISLIVAKALEKQGG